MNDTRTPEEGALESSLRKIADWQGLALSYQRINAGFTNFNYLVHVGEHDRTYFAKVVGPNTETFIDRKVAHEAAVLAADCGVAPAVVQYVAEDDFEVYEFLDGFRICTIEDMRDPDVAAKVKAAYARVHRGAPVP